MKLMAIVAKSGEIAYDQIKFLGVEEFFGLYKTINELHGSNI